MNHNRRRKKLILPRMQVGLMGSFFCVALVALAFQFLLVVRIVSQVADALPTETDVLQAEINGAMIRVGILSTILLLPAAALVGIGATFRVAGPVYRLKTWLNQVVAGETSEPCHLRDSDDPEMHELCALVNQVAEPRLAQNRNHQTSAPAAAESATQRAA